MDRRAYTLTPQDFRLEPDGSVRIVRDEVVARVNAKVEGAKKPKPPKKPPKPTIIVGP